MQSATSVADNSISIGSIASEHLQEHLPAPLPAAKVRSFSNRQIAIVCIVGFLSLAYLAIAINFPVDVHDEGIAVYSAQRVLNGYVPFRDSWTAGYPPGQSYALAILFKIFGTSLMVERISDILVRFALSLAAFFLLRRLASFNLAVMGWVMVVLMLMLPEFYYGYPIFPAILFMVLAIFRLNAYIDVGRAYQVALMGLCTGIVTFLRHDFGAYCFLALFITLALYVWKQQDGSATRFLARIIACAKILSLFAISVGIVVLPAAIYFIALVPIHDIWFNLIETARRNVSEGRWLPYPALIPTSLSMLSDWWAFYWPLVVCLVMAGLLMTKFWRSLLLSQSQRWSAMALALMGSFLFSQAVSRASLVHSLPSMLFAIMLLIVLTARFLSVFSSQSRQLIASLAVLVLSLFYFSPFLWYQWTLVGDTYPNLCQSTVPRSGCITINPDQKQAVEYIDEHTNPTDFIYVGLARHDLVFINDDIFYFLANRDSATRWHVLAPAFTTTKEIQEEMIQDITAHQVKYVVLWNIPDHTPEPNASSVSSGVTLLDDFIHSHYKSIQNFGRYSIWQQF